MASCLAAAWWNPAEILYGGWCTAARAAENGCSVGALELLAKAVLL